MSSQQQGAARRRRIAGERRAAQPTSAPETTAPEGAVSTIEAPARERRAKQPTKLLQLPKPSRGGSVSAGNGRFRAPAWWGSRRSVAVLSGALTVLVTLVALLALGLLGNDGVSDLREARAAESAAGAAPAAAERAAAAILAYNHKTLDADQDAATRFMTPDFAEQYSETFEKVVQPAAKQNQAEVTAEVLASGVVRAGSDQVRVLLFVDQTTVSTAHKNPQQALNRVEMMMVERDGTWLVDDITSY